MYTLYLDESGKADLRNVEKTRPHFSLGGVIVETRDAECLLKHADMLKYKYWGARYHEKVFHAVELAQTFIKSTGAKTPERKSFEKDLLSFLAVEKFNLCFVCTNKEKHIDGNEAIKDAVDNFRRTGSSSWQRTLVGMEKSLIEDSATKVLRMFLCFLVQNNATGNVVIEASSDQDVQILSAYNKLLSNGVMSYGMKSKDVRKYFTSIAFVTKLNHDIETQIADLSAYYLNMEERAIDGIQAPWNPTSFQGKIINAMKQKFFSYKEVNSTQSLTSYDRGV